MSDLKKKITAALTSGNHHEFPNPAPFVLCFESLSGSGGDPGYIFYNGEETIAFRHDWKKSHIPLMHQFYAGLP